MKAYKPQGAFGVLLTPFNEDGKVNFDVFVLMKTSTNTTRN